MRSEKSVLLLSIQTIIDIEKGGAISWMSIKIEADITLLLREQDVALLLKAVQQFRAKTEDEKHGRDFLLDVLEQLSLPEKSLQ
jgi:hypothetical protein